MLQTAGTLDQYLAAGQKPKAVQAFKEVGGTDGPADLARLWLIVAQRPA